MRDLYSRKTCSSKVNIFSDNKFAENIAVLLLQALQKKKN